jgi:hypothetical protein
MIGLLPYKLLITSRRVLASNSGIHPQVKIHPVLLQHQHAKGEKMSLPRSILLVPAIGAALLIAGCGSSTNTSVTAGQAADVGTEVMSNALQTFKTALGNAGVEGAAAGRAAVAATSPISCNSAGICKYATTTLPCLAEGSISLMGTFNETENTTTGIETVTGANFTLIPLASPSPAPGCSYDDVVVLTSGSATVTGTDINVDTNTGNVVLPFTLNAAGSVHFAPGTEAPTGFPTGKCDFNIIAEYEFDNSSTTTCSTAAPCAVQAAVSGNVCGKTIPANTVIQIGSIS